VGESIRAAGSEKVKEEGGDGRENSGKRVLVKFVCGAPRKKTRIIFGKMENLL